MGKTFERGLYRARRRIGESNLLVISDVAEGIDAAIESVAENRRVLESYLKLNPSYALSLSPVEVDERSQPRVASLAASSAAAAGVGPMASIPGTLADLAVERMAELGCSVSVVENGGEISAASSAPLVVAIYAGRASASGRLGFLLEGKDFPIGIATSSATVSHALSFGEADAAVVVSDSASMADAAATRVCNEVRGGGEEEAIEAGLKVAKAIPRVRGALIAKGSRVGIVGNLPKVVRLRGSAEEMFEACLLERS
ncbi:MAG: UPF0280 family protein [Candidatus Brockarchaeota archaeon]|nr:UPF0280 family protein [Candidatus Brockarchaeota archaeon]